jgi:hypothetical protein
MMEKRKNKKKQIRITIDFTEMSDLSPTFNRIFHQIQNGRPFNEFNEGQAVIRYEFEFLEREDYTEQEIDGVWFQVVKSKKINL